MGLVVPMFAIAFNVLLWLGRAALAPAVASRMGALAGWIAAIVGPAALLALMVRLRESRRDAYVLVAAFSLGAAGLLTGA